MPSPRIEQLDDDVLLYIRAVPGASRDQIAGLVGDRLKIRISAPPEAGKANKAICKLLAKALGLKPKDVTVHAGHISPEKTMRLANTAADHIRDALSD